jgi:hypothetical protein
VSRERGRQILARAALNEKALESLRAREGGPAGFRIKDLPAWLFFRSRVWQDLLDAGFTTLGDVATATDRTLLKVKGIGYVRLARIRNLLEYVGLRPEGSNATSADGPWRR